MIGAPTQQENVQAMTERAAEELSAVASIDVAAEGANWSTMLACRLLDDPYSTETYSTARKLHVKSHSRFATK